MVADSKNVVVLCATSRGLECLKKVFELRPADNLWVGTFLETKEEPLFVEDIRAVVNERKGNTTLIVSRKVDGALWRRVWENERIDLMLVISWRYMIPPAIYEKPVLGTYVFHDSLLPRYRGFAPTVWALINGERLVGASLMLIGEDVDAGPLVAQAKVEVTLEDTTATTMLHVTQCYLEIIQSHLDILLQGKVKTVDQDHLRATYTCKRLPSDNRLDWKNNSSMQLYNMIRASTRPYPGASCMVKAEDGTLKTLKVWKASLVEAPRRYAGNIPGRIISFQKGGSATVLTIDGQLQLDIVSLENEPEMSAGDVLFRISDTLV